MPQIDPQEYLAQPLRVHSFLAGVPLHDVWVVDLPALREGITLQEFRRRKRKANTLKKVSPPARALFRLRSFLGRIFGWDDHPEDGGQELFAERLSAKDRAQSIVPAGTPDEFFRVVYSFENETLLETRNRTVHAALLSAVRRTQLGYRFYFAIYVRKVSWITPVYMAMIDPFRRWVVYPEILNQIARSWSETFGPPGE